MYSYFKKKSEKRPVRVLRTAAFMLAVLLVVLCSYTPASAAPYKVSFSYQFKDVYIDGYHINNYQLAHPVTGCNGSVFIPLDDVTKPLLGIDLRIGGGRIQFVLKTPVHYSTPKDMRFVKNHFTGTLGSSYDDSVSVLLCDRFRTEEEFEDIQRIEDLRAYYKQYLESGDALWDEASKRVISALLSDLPAPDEHVKEIDLRPVDIFLCDGVVYVKASALAACEDLPYSIFYDSVGGLCISTDPKVNAKDQFSDNNKSYIAGRIAYMKSVQKLLTDNDAQILEYLFRHEAVVNGISQNLNMGIAQTESHFNISLNRVNGGKAIGLMQLMPRTVTGFGWTLAEVCTSHGNIQFGSSYIAGKLAQYNGNETLALSAYNQGSGTVASGHYSTTYARKVQSAEKEIVSWCASHGYSNTFLEVSEKVGK